MWIFDAMTLGVFWLELDKADSHPPFSARTGYIPRLGLAICFLEICNSFWIAKIGFLDQ